MSETKYLKCPCLKCGGPIEFPAHGIARLLSTNLATPGAKFYLSFLHRPEAEAEYSSVVLGTGDGAELSVGKSGSVRPVVKGGVNFGKGWGQL